MSSSSTQASESYRIIEPHWFMRLFGFKPASLQLVDSQLMLTTANGHSYVVMAENLANANVRRDGFFFADLCLTTVQGDILISGINKKDSLQHLHWLKGIWFQQLEPELAKLSAKTQRLLDSGYPRTSKLMQVMSLAKQAVKRFGTIGDKTAFPVVNFMPFDALQIQSCWTEADFALLRKNYVSHQLLVHQKFFDEIESKPLTDKQREACVIDEDNNLVLAGAGTGKTSTMVGRAGYLLQSGQAEADEILMLAFANKAAVEMQARIEKRLGDCGITASTFHKLGKDIIASVEGKQPSISPLAEDDKALSAQVNQWFELHLEDPAYQQLVLKYFEDYLYPAANPFDFDSEGAYFDFILANDIRTLKGELVKSLGECLVANYLFKLGVEYQYEAVYEHPTATALRGQYKPDFYLPEHGIYIEYYGIDRNGNTAPYIDRDEYHEGMQWKRQLHKNMQTQVIELYHYQMQESTLYQEIDAQLILHGVEAEALPAEAILATLREFGAITAFAVLLSELLKRYKANCYEPGQLEKAIAKTSNPEQVNAALALLQPIVTDYQTLLDKYKQIDFDDMIGKAITYVKSGQFKSRWRYILVDEFQDISDPRARLVKYLRDSVEDASLFCVGDDWQAIYRFTGCDLQFTTDFQSHFGVTAVTALDLTFRFNSSISDIASRFVLQNPYQLSKQLNTLTPVTKPTVSLLRADNRLDKDGLEQSRLNQVLEKVSAIAKQGSSVYLLARYRFNLPDKAELNRLAKQFPQLKLQSHTIHASKGKEADYVVILGLETGKHGFPSERQTHPLLDALLPSLDDFTYAEERRLFYVALTRARHRVYLVADMAVASDFIVELLNDNYPLELNEFETTLSQQLFHLIKCMKCKSGTMVSRQSSFGRFFGCTKYPLCSHKERGCSSCGSPMHRDGRFKVCLNTGCDNWVPACPKCGAEMTKRTSKYGEFWGCRNYRYEGECCSHTEKVIEFKPVQIPHNSIS